MMRPRTGSRFLPVVLAIGLTGAACGSLGEPYLGSFPTTSTPNQQDPLTDGVDNSQIVIVGDVTVEALPPRPADYVPSIVVVSSGGVGVVRRSESSGGPRFANLDPIPLSVPIGADPDDEDGTDGDPDTTTTTFGFDSSATTEPTEDGTLDASPTEETIEWSLARDDLFGGLVLQAVTGEVFWFPGTGGPPRVISSEGEFLDIGYSAGTPEALVLNAGQITRTRLIDNETSVFASLEAGEELIDLSSSGGIVAIAKSDDSCGSVSFLTNEGVPLGIDPLGPLICNQTSRPSVGAVAMSPDGEAVAFTLIEYREDGVELATSLRAIELTSGAEILSADVGSSGEVIESLAFDGTTAAILRRSSADSEVVVVDATAVDVVSLGESPEPGDDDEDEDPDIERDVEIDLGPPRSITFARLPLALK